MTDQPSLEDADRCAITFLTAVEHMAEGNVEAVLDTLADYTGPDGRTAHKRSWALASVGPLITAHVMRRHLADQLPPGGLWTIQSFTDLPIEQTVDASALAATRVMVEHLNAPLGDGTNPALDIIAAHDRQYGADGMATLILELVSVAAFLWREGAFNPPREEKTA